MARSLVIQLARLGDLVQSLPVIGALKSADPDSHLDLVCAEPLAPLGRLLTGIEQVIPWDGGRWRTWAARWGSAPGFVFNEIEAYLQALIPERYERAYNLNVHGRAMVAATLAAHHVVGPGESGPLAAVPPWAAYLHEVALHRGANRVHLADAFCGMCGVAPPGHTPSMPAPAVALPADLAAVGEPDGLWVALVVGAGDQERCVPAAVWTKWIEAYLSATPVGQVVLLGGGGEREAAQAIQVQLSSAVLNRVWDATGRTTLDQLAALLSRCGWVLGADTGPLHLGTALGAKALGWYFARARVHETGPYGPGHWVFQASEGGREARGARHEVIEEWPIIPSVALIVDGCESKKCDGWSLWRSHLDQWGAYYSEAGHPTDPDESREQVWRALAGSIAEHCDEHIRL